MLETVLTEIQVKRVQGVAAKIGTNASNTSNLSAARQNSRLSRVTDKWGNLVQ